MSTYKQHTIERTSTTTDAPRGGVAYLYAITDGKHRKAAGTRPFLTSERACRDYINERLDPPTIPPADLVV